MLDTTKRNRTKNPHTSAIDGGSLRDQMVQAAASLISQKVTPPFGRVNPP